jgi:hypothetical protein
MPFRLLCLTLALAVMTVHAVKECDKYQCKMSDVTFDTDQCIKSVKITGTVRYMHYLQACDPLSPKSYCQPVSGADGSYCKIASGTGAKTYAGEKCSDNSDCDNNSCVNNVCVGVSEN